MSNHNSGQGQGWPNQPYQPQEPAEGTEPGREAALSGNLGVFYIIFGVLLALLIPIFGPVVALVMGIVIRKDRRAKVLIILGGLCLAIQLLSFLLVPMFRSP